MAATAPLLALVAVGGCGRTYYTPEIAAVVVAAEPQPDGTDSFRLADGRDLNVDIAKRPIVVGSGLPHAGELLLAGSKPHDWVARLPAKESTSGPKPCFWIGGFGTESGEYIETDAGLRMPKAPGFDRGWFPVEEHRLSGNGFCINQSGQVIAVV